MWRKKWIHSLIYPPEWTYFGHYPSHLSERRSVITWLRPIYSSEISICEPVLITGPLSYGWSLRISLTTWSPVAESAKYTVSKFCEVQILLQKAVSTVNQEERKRNLRDLVVIFAHSGALKWLLRRSGQRDSDCLCWSRNKWNWRIKSIITRCEWIWLRRARTISSVARHWRGSHVSVLVY